MSPPLNQRFSTVWKWVLETVFPAFCLGCRREGSFLCDSCCASIQCDGLSFQKFPECTALDGVLACSSYDASPLLQKTIHCFKYEFVTDLARPLGLVMSSALRTALVNDAVLCPVPLHQKRLRWRGFNQAGLLAEEIGRNCSLPTANLLRRTRFLKPQMELSRANRTENVREAFELVEGAQKVETVILVDDVATTLSTLESCATMLKRAGVMRVGGIVLARVL